MKLKAGDIFTIPVTEDETGFGQIINIPNKNNFIIVVFEKMYSGKDWPSLDEIVNDKILFLGYTMDAKLYHKHWIIIGNNISNLNKIKFPYYKLGTPPENIFIVNYKGEKVRKATIDEFNSLNYQSVVAPIRYENALKANFNLLDWDDSFNDLLYTYTLDSVKLLNN